MEPICYIIGAGEDFGLDFIPRSGDLVIAADGGYRACKKAGIHPDLVVGDFDSLGAAPEEQNVITLPKVKDITDTWAALELGRGRGFRRFRLYGCTGGRIEHTIANLQTLAYGAGLGLECELFDRKQVITTLCCGTKQFGAERTGFLSVFAHGDRCAGVTLRGLKYELDSAELTNEFPLGVSNEFLGTESAVTVENGTLILVFDRF